MEKSYTERGLSKWFMLMNFVEREARSTGNLYDISYSSSEFNFIYSLDKKKWCLFLPDETTEYFNNFDSMLNRVIEYSDKQAKENTCQFNFS